MTINTRIIKMILSRTETPDVEIQPGKHLQVIPDFDALPQCKRNQSAAFVASAQMLIVWEDDAKELLELAQAIQSSLMKMLWGNDLIHPAELAEKSDKESLWQGEEAGEEEPRRLEIYQSAYTGMAILLLTTAIGSGWRQIAIQQMQEPNLLRLLFVVPLLGQVWLSLVSKSRCRADLLLTISVLLPSYCWQSCSNFRTNSSHEKEQQVLFRQSTATSAT